MTEEEREAVFQKVRGLLTPERVAAAYSAMAVVHSEGYEVDLLFPTSWLDTDDEREAFGDNSQLLGCPLRLADVPGIVAVRSGGTEA